MDYSKVAPGLISAWNQLQQGRVSDEEQEHYNNGFKSDLAKPSSPQAKKTAFVYCSEEASFPHLDSVGIQVNQSSGTIRTARFPLDRLEQLAMEPAIEYIAPSPPLRLAMDAAATVIKLPQFYQKYPQSDRDQDVIIGIVDTGIDPNHSAFKGRILNVWDQTLPNSNIQNSRVKYGAELERQEIKRTHDMHGHGTHVAGIAAGYHSRYCGIAPRAKLVIVKLNFINNIAAEAQAKVLDGINYIFDVASQNKCPAVINLSLGWHEDAHDGTDALSSFIDRVSGEGKIICCAAGNEGNKDIHAQTTVYGSSPQTITFSVPHVNIKRVNLNGWYPGNSYIDIQVESPDGHKTPWQPVIGNGNPSVEHHLPSTIVTITTSDSSYNGDHQFLVEITPKGSSYSGKWKLHLRSSFSTNVQVDVWIEDNFHGESIFIDNVASHTLIGTPGAAKKAITVGAYTSKVTWFDDTNVQQSISSIEKHIADFSSPGPLRNGYQKPDIVAPGEVIISARSEYFTCQPKYRIDDQHTVMAGTSMATPIVSGLVALMLSQNKELTPEEAREQLIKSTVNNGQPTVFNKKWGYGLIDASRLVL